MQYVHTCMYENSSLHLKIDMVERGQIASWNVDLKAQGQIDRKIIWTQ